MRPALRTGEGRCKGGDKKKENYALGQPARNVAGRKSGDSNFRINARACVTQGGDEVGKGNSARSVYVNKTLLGSVASGTHCKMKLPRGLKKTMESSPAKYTYG